VGEVIGFWAFCVMEGAVWYFTITLFSFHDWFFRLCMSRIESAVRYEILVATLGGNDLQCRRYDISFKLMEFMIYLLLFLTNMSSPKGLQRLFSMNILPISRA
jgi:hypothetical protein